MRVLRHHPGRDVACYVSARRSRASAGKNCGAQPHLVSKNRGAQPPSAVVRLRLVLFLLALLYASTGAGELQAQAPHHHDAAETPSGPTSISIPDVIVLDQDGHKLHFYTDLVKGRTVAINFIFTTCTTICPPLTANFAKLQQRTQEHGEDLQLISISVDPETDSPAKLKAYAQRFQARPGWAFITGPRSELEQIWRAFSVYTSRKEQHPATIVIGNEAHHTWTYVSGLNSADKLAAVVKTMLDRKATTTGGR
jgi:protein SCO1